MLSEANLGYFFLSVMITEQQALVSPPLRLLEVCIQIFLPSFLPFLLGLCWGPFQSWCHVEGELS